MIETRNFKIPFVELWVKVYFWTPELLFGFYSVQWNMVNTWALNLKLLSIEFTEFRWAIASTSSTLSSIRSSPTTINGKYSQLL
jgi:hypothetical protein